MVAVPAGYDDLLERTLYGIWRRPGPTVRCK